MNTSRLASQLRFPNDVAKLSSIFHRSYRWQFASPGGHLGGIGGFGGTRPQSSALGRSQPKKRRVTKGAPGSRAVWGNPFQNEKWTGARLWGPGVLPST